MKENIINKTTLLKEEIAEIAEEILEKHTDILSYVDDAIFDYMDDDWKEDGEYETEYDWYCDFGRNEAEDQVINNIINEYENNNEISFEINTFIAIGKYFMRLPLKALCVCRILRRTCSCRSSGQLSHCRHW